MSWISLAFGLAAYAAVLLYIWRQTSAMRKKLEEPSAPRASSTATPPTHPRPMGAIMPRAVIRSSPPTLQDLALGETAYIDPHGIVVDAEDRAYVNIFTLTKQTPTGLSLKVVRVGEGFRVYMRPPQPGFPLFERRSVSRYDEFFPPVLEVIWGDEQPDSPP